MMYFGMMSFRMMDLRGMFMFLYGYLMRVFMFYSGFFYNRDQYGINGYLAFIYFFMQDLSSFFSMNLVMMSFFYQNLMMYFSYVFSFMGGGRGFMIDNLLEKN